MFLPPGNDVLTRDRLINSRWQWGGLHQKPETTSFYFGKNGQVKVWAHENEHTWDIIDGTLKIYHASGTVSWTFHIVCELEDTVFLVGTPQFEGRTDIFYALLKEYKAPRFSTTDIDENIVSSPSPSDEAVRLIIWDLDDTFWRGTLSEGAITPIQENIDIVRMLNQRGIVNAICSKNSFDAAREELEKLGIWDEFIFPKISWSAKGPLIKDIIKNSQLRSESILFIDDNITNLNEARFFAPNLQIAEPSIIHSLLTDPRFKGKADPQRRRLADYKLLEKKQADQDQDRGSNENFLRNSEIRISFHTDIEAEFARVHELVNRTNQLNFTKNRWPEDLKEARLAYQREVTAELNGHCGYIKVSDKYGNYGICGFYMVRGEQCTHLLFSCRTMNMGVEQFVWNRIGRPYVAISGEVISDIDMPVDWISVVHDADKDAPTVDQRARKKLCVRGACDMMVMSNFLRLHVDVIEELNFSYRGWEICSLPRIVALHEEMQDPLNQEIIARLPGMPPGRFESDLNTGSSDVYVLSFSQETFHGLYKSRTTGMILPFGCFSLQSSGFEKRNYTTIDYSEIELKKLSGISREQWQFLKSEFEFIGGFKEHIFVKDLENIFASLKRKQKHVIIIGLNERVGRDTELLKFFTKINRIVFPLTATSSFDYIDINEFVKTEADLAPDGHFGGAHFARSVYARLAERILNFVLPSR